MVIHLTCTRWAPQSASQPNWPRRSAPIFRMEWIHTRSCSASCLQCEIETRFALKFIPKDSLAQALSVLRLPYQVAPILTSPWLVRLLRSAIFSNLTVSMKSSVAWIDRTCWVSSLQHSQYTRLNRCGTACRATGRRKASERSPHRSGRDSRTHPNDLHVRRGLSEGIFIPSGSAAIAIESMNS